MARIRSIKPSFWTSQTLAKVTRDARLAFAGLWNEADDEGRLVDAPKRLAGALFPWDEDVDAAWMDARLAELARLGVIVRYSVGGARFIAIPGFSEHQVINRPGKSSIPPPREDPLSTHGVLSEPSVAEEEEEKEGREEARAAAPVTPTNRGRQSPNAPEPLPGKILDGPVFAGRHAPRRGGWQAGKPYTIEELLRQPEGEELRRRAPALDGKGGRPRLEAVLEALWDSYARWTWPSPAMGKLETYLAEHNAKHRTSWQRDGGVDVNAIAASTPRAQSTGPPLAEDEVAVGVPRAP